MICPMAEAHLGVRPPQQRRSSESLERVLRAGEELLAEAGYEGFTVGEVSQRARISVGSVYGRFESKDALVHAIHRRLMGRMTNADAVGMAAVASATGLSLDEAVRRSVCVFADTLVAERALLRAFMIRGPVDPVIASGGSRASQEAARMFRAVILAHPGEIMHPDAPLAAEVAFRIVYDVLARQIMYGATFESDREVPWDRLLDELTAASVAYLRTSPRARRSS